VVNFGSRSMPTLTFGSQTVRHTLTNIQVDVADASSADFILYVTAYMHDSGDQGDEAAENHVPLSSAGRARDDGEGRR
jgi:hypothetical protein